MLADNNQMREDLIDGTVHAGAKYGIEGISNQTIAECSGIVKPYVYRYFIDKDDLIKKAFIRTDDNFFKKCFEIVSALDKNDSFVKRCRTFFDSLWQYSVNDLDYCIFFVRFYYSKRFCDDALENHLKHGTDAIAAMNPMFKKDADVEMVLHALFTLFVSNSFRVVLDPSADTPAFRDSTFNTLYGIIINAVNPDYINKAV